MKTIRKFSAVLAASALALLASCASPQSAADGRLPLATIPHSASELEAAFRALDANGDGFIRFHEIGGADPRIDRRFELADRNHDGKLDRTEFRELIGDVNRTARR